MIVTVKPKSDTPGGIRVIGKISQIGVYDRGDKAGTETRTEKQPFHGGMFPGSRQPYIPKWSEKRGYVLMKKASDNKLVDIDDETLNGWVEQCYFYDKDNKPIKTANRKNRNDPFFQTLITQRPLMRSEGRVNLDTDKPMDLIWLALLVGDVEDFGIAGEKSGLLSASQKFIIVDKAVDEVVESARRSKKEQASELWMAMRDDEQKIRKVARIANLSVSVKDSLQSVKNAVFAMSEDDKTFINKEINQTRQDWFVSLASMETKSLVLEDYVALAKSLGYVKRQVIDKKQVFTLQGEQCGASYESVKTFLLRPENSDRLKNLMELVDEEMKKKV